MTKEQALQVAEKLLAQPGHLDPEQHQAEQKFIQDLVEKLGESLEEVKLGVVSGIQMISDQTGICEECIRLGQIKGYMEAGQQLPTDEQLAEFAPQMNELLSGLGELSKRQSGQLDLW